MADRGADIRQDVRQDRLLDRAGLATIRRHLEGLHPGLRQAMDYASLRIHKVPEFAAVALEHRVCVDPQFLLSEFVGRDQEYSVHLADIGTTAGGLSRRGLLAPFGAENPLSSALPA